MRRALEYAGMFGIPVISHAEDPTLTGAGVMNEGYESTRLGMPAFHLLGGSLYLARYYPLQVTLARTCTSLMCLLRVQSIWCGARKPRESM